MKQGVTINELLRETSAEYRKSNRLSFETSYASLASQGVKIHMLGEQSRGQNNE